MLEHNSSEQSARLLAAQTLGSGQLVELCACAGMSGSFRVKSFRIMSSHSGSFMSRVLHVRKILDNATRHTQSHTY